AISDSFRQKLKAALWFAVGKAVDDETLAAGRNATPQFTGALTELVWEQIVSAAADLENFAKHAGRTTITADDVLLLARRNDDLRTLVQDTIDEMKEVRESAKVTKGKGKAKQ
ncbi:hypothetical protein GQ53DRAFT_648945, partial [Thozetella sp. PMI_491]